MSVSDDDDLRDPKELLQELHRHTIKTLLERVKSGEAKAADLAVARQLLKDNGIDSTPEKDPDLGSLAKHVPFQADVGDFPH